MKKICFTLFVCAFAHTAAFSQAKDRENLGNFDKRFYHFGFLLSANQSSFYVDYKPDFTFGDSLLSIENVPQAGFNLALLASANPVKNVNIRFVPGLSFQDRGLNYTFIEDGETKSYLKRTESVWLQFPLLLKLRTNRVGNFAAYALAGSTYGIDMQSQKDVNENVAGKIIIKLQKTDITLDAGGGFDFFLPYFKFGLEMKTCFGMKDILIHEVNQFADPISKLRSRTFVFSLTFEG
ncbi:MAG: PorT family protein [Flavobacteriales bacterium]|nr:PorT family protein [Flavobacteriales bacterium]